jgi:hypothetical protein
MDNLQTIWATVDLHRAIANDLEAHARLLGGDRPVQELVEVETERLVSIGGGHALHAHQEVDKIEMYREVFNALQDARETLWSVSEQEGKPREPRKFASKCRVHSQRCAYAIELLEKAGEL